MDGLPFQLTSPIEGRGQGPTLMGVSLSYNLNGAWHLYELRQLGRHLYQELTYVGEQAAPAIEPSTDCVDP